MKVLIATAGQPDSLAATLESIALAKKTSQFDRVVVIENGPAQGVRGLCERFTRARPNLLDIEYQWSPQPGKSFALNSALTSIDEDELVFMTDDDVIVDSDLFSLYSRAIESADQPSFFGGAFHVDYEQPPLEWLVKYLPDSAKGFSPNPESFDESRHCFMGCNWAAYAGDLKRSGGFDPCFGPGAKAGGTGQESQMQRQLFALGLRAHFIPDALVTHFVPQTRCSPSWTLDRAHRNGVSRGLIVSRRSIGQRATAHCLNSLRLVFAKVGSVMASKDQESEAYFRASYECNRSRGYFKGINYRDAA